MNASPDGARYCFVVPALTGPITGGTLYNSELLFALRERGVRATCCELGAPGRAQLMREATAVWVDSLYLAAVPELKRERSGEIGLILHYLPSFVDLGRAVTPGELSAEERFALASADAFLVTSTFVREALRALVSPEKPIFLVEPGTRATLVEELVESVHVPTAICVGNVVPGKGIEALLRALAAGMRGDERMRWLIVGALDADVQYAERCQRLVQTSPFLGPRVTFLGVRSHPETLAFLARAQLLVSASRMESYGMALAEAGATGVPILALAGGNAAALVQPRAGGKICSNIQELAAVSLDLLRAPARLQELVLRARSVARNSMARTWQLAAQEFCAQLEA